MKKISSRSFISIKVQQQEQEEEATELGRETKNKEPQGAVRSLSSSGHTKNRETDETGVSKSYNSIKTIIKSDACSNEAWNLFSSCRDPLIITFPSIC